MQTAMAVPSPDKAVQRAQALAHRRDFARALSAEHRVELEQRLAQRVASLLPGDAAIAGYHAMRDEFDPAAALLMATQRRHRVAFPWFASRGAPMIFRVGPARAPGPWGVDQPPADAAELRPDVVLVPLVAVDRLGNRIGRGGGHYDRALAILRQTGPVRAIGVAWEMQVRDQPIVADPWDVRLDAAVTPERIMEFHGC